MTAPPLPFAPQQAASVGVAMPAQSSFSSGGPPPNTAALGAAGGGPPTAAVSNLGPGSLVGAALAAPPAATVSSLSHPMPGSVVNSPIDPVAAGGAQVARTSSNSGVMGVMVEGVPAVGVPVGAGGGAQQMEGVVLQQQQQQQLLQGAMPGGVTTSAAMMMAQQVCGRQKCVSACYSSSVPLTSACAGVLAW